MPGRIAVGAGDLKAGEIGALGSQPAAEVIEEDAHGGSIWAGQSEGRTGVLNVLMEGDGAGGKSEAAADLLLVLGMDVRRVADVDGDGHAGVLEGEGAALCLTQVCPLGAGGEVGELHIEEREVAHLPASAPILNHGGEELLIVEGAVFAGVALALVPDGSADGELGYGGDHGVEEAAGHVGAHVWVSRKKVPSP